MRPACGSVTLVIDEHQRILSAIEAHDVDGAALTMGRHIERLLGDIAAIKDINPEFFDERG